MPKVVRSQPWEISFREEVSSLAKGWNVKERRGKVFLRVRTDEKETSIYIPFAWSKDQKRAATNRIQNIYFLVKNDGHDLKSAAKIAAGEAPKLINQIDWAGYIEAFKEYKTESDTAIQISTWDKHYYLSEEILKTKEKKIEDARKKAKKINKESKLQSKKVFPVLNYALEHLEKGTYTNPKDLLKACLKHWNSGSRTRAIAARNLTQFLTYCIDDLDLADSWTPPKDTALKRFIGEESKDKEYVKVKGDEVDDQILIDLINSIADDKWSFALKLIAELGLRPVELMYLQIKKDVKTKKPYWYCTYEKKSGKGKTEARKLYQLKLKDEKGITQEWDLLNKFQKKEIELPDFSNYSYGVADALKNHITRKYSQQAKKWTELKQKVQEEESKNLTLYSFRHTYSLRGHNLNIDGGSMALAMGHNFKTHCEHYSWAKEATTDKAFAKAA